MAFYSGTVYIHYTALTEGHKAWLSHFAPIDGILLLLLGPCLYFYCRSLLRLPSHFFRMTTLWHLLPFLPYLIFNIVFLQWPAQQRIHWVVCDFNSGATEMIVLNAWLYVQMIVYLLICYQLVRKQLGQSSVISFGAVETDLSWLRNYLLISLGFILLSLPVCFYFANEHANLIIGQLGIDIQFIYMFFKWTLPTEPIIIVRDSEPVIKKNTSSTENNCPDKYEQILTRYMEKEKPYLEDECSVQTVSQQTGIPLYQLTNLLNNVLKTSFPDYINQYRIHDAKLLLLSEKSSVLTIESIATECGFGSKSAFYRAFKKLNNGLTPAEFVRQQQNLAQQN
jgi:AraC-like DNA-binding protein